MSSPTTANVTRPRADGFGVLLNEDYFRLAVGPERPLTIQTTELQAPPVQTAQNPEEIGTEFGQVYARSEFSGGEGLDRAHQREEVEGQATRYWDSLHVNIRPPQPGEPNSISLLHATEVRVGGVSPATVAPGASFAYLDDRLYSPRGDDVLVILNPLAADSTETIEDPHAGEPATSVQSVVRLGEIVYAALGPNGIHRKVPGTGWVHWSDLDADRLWAVKDRIVARGRQTPSQLFEVVSSGAAPVALKTLSDGTVWTDVVDGHLALLASSLAGDIYTFVASEQGELVERTRLGFENGPVLGMAQTRGVVMIASRAPGQGNLQRYRIWRSVLSPQYELVETQLLREWRIEDAAPFYPAPVRAVGDRIYAATPATAPGNTEPETWCYDVRTGGVARDLTFNVGEIRDLIGIAGRLLAVAADAAVHRETETFRTSGWLITPLGDFFRSEDKQWVGSKLVVQEALVSEQRVDLSYTTSPAAIIDPDDPSWTLTQSITGAPDNSEQVIEGARSRYIAGKVELFSSLTNDASPHVLSASFRGYPVDPDLIVELPINVSDVIERPNRSPVRVGGLGQATYTALKALEGEAVQMTLLRSGDQVRGIVELVSAPSEGISDRGSVTTFAAVRVRGRRLV